MKVSSLFASIAGSAVLASTLLINTVASPRQLVVKRVELQSSEPRTSQATPSATPDWPRLVTDEGDFAIMLPAGWLYTSTFGFDMNAGIFMGDGITLTFESGYFSNKLVDPGAVGYEVTFESIDGRRAKVVVARSLPADITGVYFADIRERPDRPWTIQVHGNKLAPAEQELVLRILRTMTFPTRTPWPTRTGTLTFRTPSPTPTFGRTVWPSNTPRPSKTPTKSAPDLRRIHLPFMALRVKSW